MEYIGIECKPVTGVHTSDVLISMLADAGFESFVENESGTVTAYIPSKFYTEILAAQLHSAEFADFLESFKVEKFPDLNWNAVWESEYQPIVIDERCKVRAPFHYFDQNLEYDIVIMPKMSFGTAHHETTKMMIQYLLEMTLSGKSLLDMGSGTGVLALLAAKKGASPVTAIDNDEWAYNNAFENVQSNNQEGIEVLLGDSSLLDGRHFDIVLANINRNILLKDIPAYRQSLNENGFLLVSGFYSEDLPHIVAKARENGLILISEKEDNRWTSALFSI